MIQACLDSFDVTCRTRNTETEWSGFSYVEASPTSIFKSGKRPIVYCSISKQTSCRAKLGTQLNHFMSFCHLFLILLSETPY